MKVNLKNNQSNMTSFKMAVITKKSAVKAMSKVALKNNFTDLTQGLAALTEEQANNDKVNVIVKKANVFSSKVKFLIKNAITNTKLLTIKQKNIKDTDVLNNVRTSIETANQVVENTQKLTTKLSSKASSKVS